MLRRQRQIRTQVHQIVDTIIFGVALWLAFELRDATGEWTFWRFFGGTVEIDSFAAFIWLYFVILPFAPLVLDWQGFYVRPLVPSRVETGWQLLKGCSLLVIGLILVMFVLKIYLARSVIILFGGVSFLLVWAKEEIIRGWLASKVAQSQLKKRLILVGTKEDTVRLRADLQKQAGPDIDVVVEVDINEESTQKLVDLMHEHSPNGVILTAKHTFFGQIEKAIEVCEREGVEVWLMADFFKTQISKTTLDDFYGRPMLVFRTGPDASWQRFAKEIIDVVGSFAMIAVLCVFLPILPLAALAIRLTSPGPIIFRQQRSGLNGRPFTMWKFRTMVTNADQLKQEIAQLNEMSGPVFKVTNDPRVTPIGKILRRYSIDELPQLFNVLRGEMSLVGPRPLPVDEVQRFDDPSDRRRLSVKPGLTCLWQVSGRNNVSDFKDWVRLDLQYIDQWSLWLDIKILFRTIPAVFVGTGAK